jgi:hypothetical protein
VVLRGTKSPPGLLTGTDRKVLAVWVVACVEHARAAAEDRRMGQVVKTKDGNAINNLYLGIVNRQSAQQANSASHPRRGPRSA